MNQSSPLTWRRALSWVFTGLTLLIATLLIWQCADIYFAGVAPENHSPDGVRLNDIYSRDMVAERLARLTIPAVLWAIAVAVLIVAQLMQARITPAKFSIPQKTRLELMLARVEKTEAMLHEERRRRNAGMICLTVCAACVAVSAVYLLNRNHFISWDLEMVMGMMLLNVLPPVIVMFAALFAFEAWQRGSIARELEAAKSAPRIAASQKAHAGKKKAPLTACRIVLYAVAVALVIAGILNGGMYDVLVKAINICTECIGLG